MILQLIAAIFCLLGTWLIAKKDRGGFLCYIVSNTALITFSAINGFWIMFLQFVLLTIISIKGFIDWR